MAETTGISWTDATVNFVIGCTRVGPGCERCYAAHLAFQKWGIVYEDGGERRVTKYGFEDPLRWQRKHDGGILEKVKADGAIIKTPVWVFACSLSDFFDNKWPPEVRKRAWVIIRECRSLRWQIVTKRVGNVVKMLPEDWDEGRNYPHVGIIATVVDQPEYDRDASKLHDLYRHGVAWTGLSIEPQLGRVTIDYRVDWIIVGGESKQGKDEARPFHIEWAEYLILQGLQTGIPVFMKQLGDNPHYYGGPTKNFGRDARTDAALWPAHIRVQQMPHIYHSQPKATLL